MSHFGFRVVVVVAMWVGGLLAQGAATAVAKANDLLERAKKAARVEAGRLLAEALDALAEAPGAADDEKAAYCWWMLADEASRRGHWLLAERSWRCAAAYYARAPGEKDQYALAAKRGLAVALGRQDAPEKRREAMQLQREVLDAQRRHHGEDSDQALHALRELAVTLNGSEDWRAALPEWLRLVKAYEDRKQHADLHDARINLCDVYKGLLLAAELRQVVEAMDEAASLLPAGDERLRRQVDSVTSLVDVSHSVGDAQLRRDAARILERRMAEYRSAIAAKPGSAWCYALQQLGEIRSRDGDLPGALAALDEYFEIWDGTYESFRDHLIAASMYLVSIRNQVGNYGAAHAIGSRVLAVMPASNVAWGYVADLKRDVALAAFYSGDLAAARQLNAEVVSFFETRWPLPAERNHRHRYWTAVHNLAYCDLVAGRLDESREQFQQVLAAPRVWLHPSSRFHLAWIAHEAKPSAASLAQLLDLYEAEMEVSSWGAWRGEVRQRLVRTIARAGDRKAMSRLMFDGLKDASASIEGCLFLSDRERAETLGQLRTDIDWAISNPDPDSPLFQRLVFQVLESRRAAAQTMTGLFVQRQDAALERLLADYALVREKLGEAGASAAAEQDSLSAEERERQTTRRDRLQREIRQRQTVLGQANCKITAEDVAVKLPRGTAAVGFYRYSHWSLPATAEGKAQVEDKFIAQVVVPGADAVQSVDLGPAVAIEAAIKAWREALGQPIDRGRPADAGTSDVLATGRALRKLVVDGVRKAAGAPAKTLYVCLDDALHLVPLDALPTDGGKVLGDEVAIRVLPSFQSLVRPLPKQVPGKPTLLAVGGIDFGKVAKSTDRGKEDFAFDGLPFTADEVVKIGDLFKSSFAQQGTVLRGAEASKDRVAEKIQAARFVHVATHGWYAPADVRSLADPVGDRVASAGHGHSPLALCGLALAGANGGRDRDGRLPGILSAEHLAGLDLRGCELAVLSACRTNAGLRRSGQSIQSLQTALHSAGARSAVTSLWRVPDSLTEELMVRFYKNLWQGKLPPHEALWEAKTWLRKERSAKERDWAAWVLTTQ